MSAEDAEGRKTLAGYMGDATKSATGFGGAWPVHASLPLTDHPVPDIA